MKRIEIDWHIDPLRDVLAGIDHGLRKVLARSDEVDWFDGGFVMDHSEWLLGVAFVGAQAYIESAIGDIWRHLCDERELAGKASKNFRKKCLLCDTETVAAGVSRVELISATANYYKHHGGPGALRPDTARILHSAGIDLSDAYAYPCAHAAKLLCGPELHLQAFCDIVKSWRARIAVEIAGVEPCPVKRRRCGRRAAAR